MENQERKIDLKSHLLLSLDTSWDKYNSELTNCRHILSEKAVHDIRVCMRRFLALILAIDELLPNSSISAILPILKEQIKIFNPMRDTQVQILTIQKLVYNYPILYLYYHHLLNIEENEIIALKEKIEFFNNNKIANILNVLKETIANMPDSSNDFALFFDVAKVNYQNVLEQFQFVSEDNLQSIHKVRLSFKKYRYTLEILRPATNMNDDDFIRMKEFQTRMGNIQDNAVLVKQINKFTKIFSSRIKNDFKPILIHLLEERTKLIEEFLSKFNDIKLIEKSSHS